MNWETIFRDAVSGCAGVVVYDKGQADFLGRYVIAKTMKLASGRTLTTQSDSFQRPAALRRAKKFLTVRAKMFGREYVPGDGVNTLAFAPLKGGES